MDATSFVRRVVGDEGEYCLFLLSRAQGKRVQKFYRTVDDLVAAAKSYDGKGWDTYFSLATFNDDSSRYASNVKQMRSLFLDLDCGPDKVATEEGEQGRGYPDQRTALAELRKFCRGFGLPRPILVNSGYGVHAYWALEAPCTLAEWKPVAEALKAACAKRGLLADPSITADAARILRVPETHNHKHGAAARVAVVGSDVPEPVRLADLKDIFGVADGLVALAPTPFSSKLAAEMTAMQERLSQNTTSRFKRILERTLVGDGCEQLGELVRHPERADEPMWRAGLSIAAHCVDRDKAIHVVSKGHPEYDPEDTERKARHIKGPYTCEKFDGLRGGICKKCPFNRKIKSPIVLGRELAAAPAEDVTISVLDKNTGIVKEYDVPKLPSPYTRGRGGGVYKMEESEDGIDHKLIYVHDIYIVRRSFDRAKGVESATVRLHLPQDGVREFEMPLPVLHAPQEFAKLLASHGVTIRGKKQWDELAYYFMDWIAELQMRAAADDARRQFGWTEGMHSFLIGDREYVEDGTVRNNTATPATQPFMQSFRPKGTLAQWCELMKAYDQPGMEIYQLMMCASFGSPLMAFLPDNGVLFHLYSYTGYGKTTLQLAALSVWGNPTQLTLAMKDTDNSAMNRMELMKNLPVVFDEMTNNSPQALSDLVYSVTQGRQKNRLAGGENVERVRGDPWALIVITSGNASFYDKLDVLKADAAAEKVRALEIPMAKHVSVKPKASMKQLEMDIKNNCFGLAGDEFMRFIVRNKAHVHGLLKSVQEKLDDRAELTQEDRFISSGISCALTAGLIAHDRGLLPYDPKHLFDYSVEFLRNWKRGLGKGTLSPAELLAAFVAEHTDKILRIDSSQRRGAGASEIVIPDSVARGQLVARYEPDVGRLYIRPKPLRAWCAEQQLNYSAFLAELADTYKVETNRKMLLTKGTTMERIDTKVTVVHYDMDEDQDAPAESEGDEAE